MVGGVCAFGEQYKLYVNSTKAKNSFRTFELTKDRKKLTVLNQTLLQFLHHIDIEQVYQSAIASYSEVIIIDVE